MTERELEEKLRVALDHAAPNDVESVLSRCSPRTERTVPMAGRALPRRAVRWVAAACAALVLLSGGVGFQYHQANAVACVVSLDVNPSIELRVNRNEKVLSAQALNSEAAAVLGDMDLRGTPLNVAVNAIVGSLLKLGYLDSLSSAILISVEDQNTERAQSG